MEGLLGLLVLALTYSFGNSMQKTVSKGVTPSSFSCEGRISGYYADIETGCQTYHFCDGRNRQFSYACPNNTLFQQRMMICDHWYMVDCGNSEKDYNANLLIGQKDEPFVSKDEELKFALERTKPVNFRKPEASNFIKSAVVAPSIALLPPVQNNLTQVDTQRKAKATELRESPLPTKDTVIKLLLDDTRKLFFISDNSSTPEKFGGAKEFFVPLNGNEIATSMRFKKNPKIDGVCPKYCHPRFLIPGTCHPCLMIK